MKNLFIKKLSDLNVSSLLKSAQQKEVKLLPASSPKSLAQLPIPQTPFDHYQRSKLIGLLNFKRFVGERSVLEVGCGVGDLLMEMYKHKPKELYGVDSSTESIQLAKEYLKGLDIDLSVADARRLPFPEKSFDVVMVMYELQHIENNNQMLQVVDEATRVARHWVVLVEETTADKYIFENIVRRTVTDYKDAFKNARSGRFFLRKTDYLHVNASRYIFTGTSNPWHWIRWVFSPLLYLMGFPSTYMKLPTSSSDIPDSKFALFLQKLSLPFASSLDGIFQANDGTTAMWFEREKLFRRG